MKAIEVGCWAVMHLRTSCCRMQPPGFGLPFVVTKVYVSRGSFTCRQCKVMHVGPLSLLGGLLGGRDIAFMSMCKRIDPPADSTSLTRELETVL